MSTQNKFWIVWNPRNPRSLTVRHPDKPTATAEALRLANRPENFGQEFYVMGEEGVASAPKPTAVWSERAPEAPWLPEGDGWIEWSGGKNPVPGATVEWLTPGERNARSYTPAVIESDKIDDWTVVVAYRVVEPAKKRELKHGEYLPGDRVRYVGRSPFHNEPEHIGRLGTVGSVITEKTIEVLWDGQSPKPAWGVYPENIEHESLPQFRKGDRVRVGPKGLGNVREAAGKDAKVTARSFNGDIEVSIFHPVRADFGNIGRTFFAKSHEISLLIPAREGV